MTQTPATRSSEIRKRLRLAREALALANSMILSGESHTNVSHAIIRQGLAATDLSRPLEVGE